MANLKDYVNRHKDKIGFVLGSGPSLRNLDSDVLKSHITIAVNSSIVKVPEAQYYFTCDQSMTLWESWHSLKNLECDLILASNCGLAVFDSRINRNAFEGISKKRIQYIGRKKDNIIDRGDKLIKGSSSVHPAVHFAYVLGCSPIVLIGCDCKYVDGKKWFYEFSGQPTDKLLKPEYKKYQRPLAPYVSGSKTDGELIYHLRIWKEIEKQNLNMEIIDASGGALSMFPQMTLKEILKKYE